MDPYRSGTDASTAAGGAALCAGGEDAAARAGARSVTTGGCCANSGGGALASLGQGSAGSSGSDSTGPASVTLGCGAAGRCIRMGMISAVERTVRAACGGAAGGSGVLDVGAGAAAAAPGGETVLLVPQ